VNFKHLAWAAALALAAGGASAAATKIGGGDLAAHDATEVAADSISLPAYSAFDDTWTFTLGSSSVLGVYAQTFDISSASNLTGTTLTLYDSSNTALGSIAFDGTTPQHVSFGALGPGSYYYEVVGSLASGATNGAYQFASVAIPAVPEPASGALLLAGLGVAGFLARRRKA